VIESGFSTLTGRHATRNSYVRGGARVNKPASRYGPLEPGTHQCHLREGRMETTEHEKLPAPEMVDSKSESLRGEDEDEAAFRVLQVRRRARTLCRPSSDHPLESAR
jgi:hypothetical protein